MSKKRWSLVGLLVLLIAVCCGFLAACGGKESKVTLSWNLDANVQSVQIEGYEYSEEMQFAAGTEISFTVTCKTGYEISTVSGAKKQTNGSYTYTVSQNATIKIVTKEIINDVTVAWADGAVTYYAGQTVAPDDIIVTAKYAVQGDVVIDDTRYAIGYENGNAFALGDAKFTVTFGSFVKNVTVDTVVMLVVINPEVAKIDTTQFEGYDSYKVEKGIISFTVSEPLETAIQLPDYEGLETLGDRGDYELQGWRMNGTTVTAIPAGTAVSVSVQMEYEAKLIVVDELYFTTKSVTEGEDTVEVPYLIIKGTFKAAETAYIRLYEGNQKAEFIGDEIQGKRDEDFTLEFDLRKIVNATYGEDEDKFDGMWIDLSFVAKLGERDETQEINIYDYSDDFCDYGQVLIWKQDEDTTYKFNFMLHNPYNNSDNTDKLMLKMQFNEYTATEEDYKVTKVAVVERDGVAYLAIYGEYYAEVESNIKLAEIVGDELATTYIQNLNGWGMVETTKSCEVIYNENGVSTFVIYMSLANAESGQMLYFRVGGTGDSNNLDTTAIKVNPVVVGTMEYKLGIYTGWGTQVVVLYPKNTYEIDATKAELVVEGEDEDEKIYFVLSGTWSGTLTKEEFEALVVNYDFQGNPYVATNDWDGDWERYNEGSFEFIVNDDGTFELKVDISMLKSHDYMLHLSVSETATTAPDFNPDMDSFESEEVAFGDKVYKLIFVNGSDKAEEYYGLIGLHIEDAESEEA